MTDKRIANQRIGGITSGLDKQANLVLKTIGFVYEQLPSWRDDPDRPIEHFEPKLNSQLCDFLDSRARNLFPMIRFNHEELQHGRRSVDLSAKPVASVILEARLYTKYDPIIAFECKRLPAPSPDREKEYVTGGISRTSGGIQRFKLGVHGANLDLAVMIGYLQERSAREWHNKINGWISELCNGAIPDTCVWSDNEALDRLNENVSTGLAICRSVHNRTGGGSGNEIEIHHLWISMNMR